MLQDLKLKEMSTEEYFYLTENLEIVDKDTICGGVSFLLYNKKKRLLDTVKKVMQNELTDQERDLANDYWVNELTLGEISKRNNISKSSAFRHIKCIEKKLETSLKYVLIYDSDSLPESATEMLNYIKETQIERRKNFT